MNIGPRRNSGGSIDERIDEYYAEPKSDQEDN